MFGCGGHRFDKHGREGTASINREDTRYFHKLPGRRRDARRVGWK